MEAHELWVEHVVSECADEIFSFDPESQQSMRFHPEPWKRWNTSDSGLNELLDKYRDGIHRRDLKQMARHLSTPDERRIAFIATLLWGAGPTNRYYGRHAKALRAIDLDQILDDSARQVREDDLEGAWSAASMIPGLAFRFFTKWLWLAGTSSYLQVPPLIYDQQVRNALAKANWAFDHRRIDEKRRWVNYCRDAATVAEVLSRQPGAPAVTSEWVEYWLFSGAPGAERIGLIQSS